MLITEFGALVSSLLLGGKLFLGGMSSSSGIAFPKGFESRAWALCLCGAYSVHTQPTTPALEGITGWGGWGRAPPPAFHTLTKDMSKNRGKTHFTPGLSPYIISSFLLQIGITAPLFQNYTVAPMLARPNNRPAGFSSSAVLSSYTTAAIQTDRPICVRLQNIF